MAKKHKEDERQVEEVKDDIQRKQIEFQMLEHQLKQIQKQIESLGNQGAELENVKSNLDGFGETKKEDEIFAPLGAGIFFKAKIADSSKILVNVGSDVLVEKTIDETKRLIDMQTDQIHLAIEQLTFEFEKGKRSIEKIQGDLMGLLQ